MIALSAQTRRRIVLISALILAGLLAFPLRKVIYGSVVVPIAFVAWNLNLLYRSFSQAIWWAVITGIVLFMLLFSLIPQPKFRRAAQVKPRRQVGQVEDLAVALQKAERGIYFKWLIANRLGKLAYQILLHRESGRPRSLFAPLAGTDWEPTQELQKYLETGLHGSFADFPQVNRPFGVPQKTPLDVNVSEAVEFLESQVENGQLPQKLKE